MKRSLICTLVVAAAGAQPQLEVVATLYGNGNVQAAAMAVDPSGNVYLAGSTTASGLATAGAYQSRTASSSLYRYLGAGTPLPPRHPRSRVDRAVVKFRPVYLVRVVLLEDQFSPAPGDARQALVVLLVGDVWQPGVTIWVR